MELKTIIVFISLCTPFLLMTILAIVDVGQKDFDTLGRKAFWGVMASIPFIGFIIYLIFGFRRGKKF